MKGNVLLGSECLKVLGILCSIVKCSYLVMYPLYVLYNCQVLGKPEYFSNQGRVCRLLISGNLIRFLSVEPNF